MDLTRASRGSAAEIFPAASPCLRTLKQILADSADGAFVVDARGLIIFWNRAAERFLGWSEQEVIGLACCEALASVDINAFGLCGRDCRALTAGTVKGDAHRLEMQTRTKAGQAVWLDIIACETPTSRGGPSAVVHLFRDVTATMRALDLIPRASSPSRDRAGPLSARELQILGMMAAGANTRTMATRLGVAPATIRNHAQSIFSKLGVHSRLEAVAWMHSHRLRPTGGGGRAARGTQFELET